jgi:large subunit ribosomal protein L30
MAKKEKDTPAVKKVKVAKTAKAEKDAPVAKIKVKKEKVGPTAKKVRITQIRSMIKRPERQQRTIQSLGLGRVHQSVEVEYTPQIEGMAKKVSHLVSVKDL